MLLRSAPSATPAPACLAFCSNTQSRTVALDLSGDDCICKSNRLNDAEARWPRALTCKKPAAAPRHPSTLERPRFDRNVCCVGSVSPIGLLGLVVPPAQLFDFPARERSDSVRGVSIILALGS